MLMIIKQIISVFKKLYQRIAYRLFNSTCDLFCWINLIIAPSSGQYWYGSNQLYSLKLQYMDWVILCIYENYIILTHQHMETCIQTAVRALRNQK